MPYSEICQKCNSSVSFFEPKLECGHHIHQKCILTSNGKCPVCGINIIITPRLTRQTQKLINKWNQDIKTAEYTKNPGRSILIAQLLEDMRENVWLIRRYPRFYDVVLKRCDFFRNEIKRTSIPKHLKRRIREDIDSLQIALTV